MSADESMVRDQELLQRYHDGELGWLARRRFERRLARSPGLERELRALVRLREEARRADAAAAAPDLWSGVAAGLRRIDAGRPEASADHPLPFRALLGPALGLGAAAALVVAVAVGLRDTGPAPLPPAPGGAVGGSLGVVRWIDPGPNSVLVLEDGSDATIIWVLEGRQASRGGGRDAV